MSKGHLLRSLQTGSTQGAEGHCCDFRISIGCPQSLSQNTRPAISVSPPVAGGEPDLPTAFKDSLPDLAEMKRAVRTGWRLGAGRSAVGRSGRPAPQKLISFAHRVAPNRPRSARLRRRHFPAFPPPHASLTAAPSIPQREYDTPGRRSVRHRPTSRQLEECSLSPFLIGRSLCQSRSVQWRLALRGPPAGARAAV